MKTRNGELVSAVVTIVWAGVVLVLALYFNNPWVTFGGICLEQIIMLVIKLTKLDTIDGEMYYDDDECAVRTEFKETTIQKLSDGKGIIHLRVTPRKESKWEQELT